MINIGIEEDAATSARLVAAARLDTHASQAAFRLLLGALSRPGLVHATPVDLLALDVPAPLLVALALADVDVRIAVTGTADALTWTKVVADATGGRPCVLEAADIVVALGAVDPADLLALRRGRPEAPEEAARLAIACRRLTGVTGPVGITVEVQGPGVKGSRRFGVDGLDAELFTTLSKINAEFPAGVDTWLLADDGAVVGLPRTTDIRIIGP
jgi:alpha-D-ribose 1-methylphosphonate 5-triphosphate synthase subunit PhnH